MLDRSQALQILGLPEGADESEAAVAYRMLRRHVQARERSAGNAAAREVRGEELRDLERAWRALSSLPVPTGVIQPTKPLGARGLPKHFVLAWAVVASLAVLLLGGYLLVRDQGFGPRVLMDGGGTGGGTGGGEGFAIAGEDEAGAAEGEDGETGALDAGPRTELVVDSEVEGALVTVRTRGETAEVVAEGDADDTSYWLSPGAYAVAVRHPECRGAWQQDVDVAEGQARVKVDPELCRETGWMVVRSNVPEDELSIDGKKLGATGDDKHPVAPGEHEVRVAKNGYQSWEGIVEVEPGQVLGIRPRLEAVQPAARKPRPKKPQSAGGAAKAASARRAGEEAEKEQRDHRWHEDARRWLLARYDYDRSGEIDSREELEAITCETWLGLEQSYDQSRLGLSLTRFYGFDGTGWRSGALGIADQTRDLAYQRMQACGLR